jgi:hypothetical protein
MLNGVCGGKYDREEIWLVALVQPLCTCKAVVYAE